MSIQTEPKSENSLPVSILSVQLFSRSSPEQSPAHLYLDLRHFDPSKGKSLGSSASLKKPVEISRASSKAGASPNQRQASENEISKNNSTVRNDLTEKSTTKHQREQKSIYFAIDSMASPSFLTDGSGFNSTISNHSSILSGHGPNRNSISLTHRLVPKSNAILQARSSIQRVIPVLFFRKRLDVSSLESPPLEEPSRQNPNRPNIALTQSLLLVRETKKIYAALKLEDIQIGMYSVSKGMIWLLVSESPVVWEFGLETSGSGPVSQVDSKKKGSFNEKVKEIAVLAKIPFKDSDSKPTTNLNRLKTEKVGKEPLGLTWAKQETVRLENIQRKTAFLDVFQKYSIDEDETLPFENHNAQKRNNRLAFLKNKKCSEDHENNNEPKAILKKTYLMRHPPKTSPPVQEPLKEEPVIAEPVRIEVRKKEILDVQKEKEPPKEQKVEEAVETQSLHFDEPTLYEEVSLEKIKEPSEPDSSEEKKSGKRQKTKEEIDTEEKELIEKLKKIEEKNKREVELAEGRRYYERLQRQIKKEQKDLIGSLSDSMMTDEEDNDDDGSYLDEEYLKKELKAKRQKTKKQVFIDDVKKSQTVLRSLNMMHERTSSNEVDSLIGKKKGKPSSDEESMEIEKKKPKEKKLKPNGQDQGQNSKTNEKTKKTNEQEIKTKETQSKVTETKEKEPLTKGKEAEITKETIPESSRAQEKEIKSFSKIMQNVKKEKKQNRGKESSAFEDRKDGPSASKNEVCEVFFDEDDEMIVIEETKAQALEMPQKETEKMTDAPSEVLLKNDQSPTKNNNNPEGETDKAIDPKTTQKDSESISMSLENSTESKEKNSQQKPRVQFKLDLPSKPLEINTSADHPSLSSNRKTKKSSGGSLNELGSLSEIGKKLSRSQSSLKNGEKNQKSLVPALKVQGVAGIGIEKEEPLSSVRGEERQGIEGELSARFSNNISQFSEKLSHVSSEPESKSNSNSEEEEVAIKSPMAQANSPAPQAGSPKLARAFTSASKKAQDKKTVDEKYADFLKVNEKIQKRFRDQNFGNLEEEEFNRLKEIYFDYQSVLTHGIQVIKYGQKTMFRPSKRLIRFDPMMTKLIWCVPGKIEKIKKSFLVNELLKITVGKETTNFRRFSKPNPKLCFSFILAKRTIDLECENSREFQKFISAFRFFHEWRGIVSKFASLKFVTSGDSTYTNYSVDLRLREFHNQ